MITRERLSQKRQRKTRRKDRRKTSMQKRSGSKTYLELFTKRSREGRQAPQAVVSSDNRWVASNCCTTSPEKEGPPKAREGEGEAGWGKEGTTKATSREARVKPLEGPGATATVTSGATKSATPLGSSEAPAATPSTECCESRGSELVGTAGGREEVDEETREDETLKRE